MGQTTGPENDKANRRSLLLAAAKGASQEYMQNALYDEEQKGPSAAAVEYSVLVSWVSQLVQPEGDNSWLEQRLAAIAYRGGPRNKEDEAYLQLDLTEDQLDAFTAIIREKQLEVANGFFGIHSGAYAFSFEPLPELRFRINYGRLDANFAVVEQKERPNGIDELFLSYASTAR